MSSIRKYLFRLALALFSVLLILLLQRLDLIPPANYYRVVEVLDGDTIVVDMAGRLETVRFIGVDTPETHHPEAGLQCYGQKASDFTHSLLDGQTVLLIADSDSTNRDRYDRLLRYVINEEGTNINSLLVRQGYGFAITGFNHSQMALFTLYETEAETLGRGLWGACQIDFSGAYPQTQQLAPPESI